MRRRAILLALASLTLDIARGSEVRLACLGSLWLRQQEGDR